MPCKVYIPVALLLWPTCELQGCGRKKKLLQSRPQSNIWNVGAGSRTPCAQCARFRTLLPAHAAAGGTR